MSENERARAAGAGSAGQEKTTTRSGPELSASHRLSRTVEVDRAEFELLKVDAAAWRLLMTSRHVAELLAEFVEWTYRSEMSESTARMAALYDWRRESQVPTYAELQRRRGDTARVLLCDYKLCMEPGVTYRCPQTRAQIILCPRHAHHGIPEQNKVRRAA